MVAAQWKHVFFYGEKSSAQGHASCTFCGMSWDEAGGRHLHIVGEDLRIGYPLVMANIAMENPL